MSAPAAAPHPGQNPRPLSGIGSFEGVVDRAIHDRVLGTTSPPSLADPEPRALLRYACGRSDALERPVLESWVGRSSWAYERVLCLVKAARPDAPALARALARRLPDAPTAAAAVAAAVLEARGDAPGSAGFDFAAALERLQKPDDSTRAALLLGLGRHEEARKLLSKPHPPSSQPRSELSKNAASDPLADLLRRLADSPASANDPDQALLAVLDAFPSLLDNQ